MPGPLQQLSFGPFQGLVDTANPSLGMQGKLRAAVGVRYSGFGRLSARVGTRTVLTFKDDAGTPANVTTVCAVAPFADGALAVAHSTVTGKVYLYRLTYGGRSDFNGWIDAAGAAHTTLFPQPIGVLWSSIATAPDVTIAEGLGIGYIAHAAALDGTTLVAPTKMFTDATRAIATLQSDLDVTGTQHDIYFRGVISFQQHLWGWSFGSGTSAATGFRPEMLRFSHPIFDPSGGPGAGGLFSGGTDSFTIGNRVRSQREQVVGAGLVGSAMIVGAPFLLVRFTGNGRDSWYRQTIDQALGFTGPKCMVTVGATLYYMSSKGPMRVTETGRPEALWTNVIGAAAAILNPQKVVAAYDEATDIVSWTYDGGNGVRAWMGYDIARELFLVAGDDWGQAIFAAGSVSPVYQSTAAASTGPVGPPTSPVTSSIGPTTATAAWVAGDPAAASSIEIRVQGGTTWTVLTPSLSAGVAVYTMSDLAPLTAYEWRVAHVRDTVYSSYLGPSAATQFTTADIAFPNPPSAFSLASSGSPTAGITAARWTNSGDVGVTTQLWVAGPSAGTPADGDYSLEKSLDTGIASTTFTRTDDGTYWGKVRHVNGPYTSAFSNTDSCIVLTGGGPES